MHPFQYLSNRNLCLLSYTYTTNTCKMYTFIFHTLAWMYFWCTLHPHQYDIRAFITCDAAKPSWSIRDYIQGIVRHGNYQGLDYTGAQLQPRGSPALFDSGVLRRTFRRLLLAKVAVFTNKKVGLRTVDVTFLKNDTKNYRAASLNRLLQGKQRLKSREWKT